MTIGKCRFIILASCALFALSLAQNWAQPQQAMPLWYEALRAAANLAWSGTLASPFAAGPTGPTAHIGPAYPFAASLLISVFGVNAQGFFVLQLVTNLVVAFHVAMLPLAAELLGLGFSTGVLAGLFHIAAQVPTYPAWEASYVALLVMLLTVLVVRFVTRGYSTRSALAIGLLWGILILTSPTVTLLFLVWLVHQLLHIKREWHRLPRVALVLAWLPVFMALPWTIRNYVVLGSFVPLRDNLGLELEVSNNPCSAFNIARNIETGCFHLHHPNFNRDETLRVRTLGEVAYNEDKLKRAIGWIRSNPDRFIELTVQRVVHFWLPSDESDLRLILQDRNGRRRYSLIVWLITLLSLPGLYLIVRDNKKRLATVFCLWLALYPIVYYVTQFDIRYRLPILWISFLLAGHAVIRIIQSRMSRPAAEAAQLH